MRNLITHYELKKPPSDFGERFFVAKKILFNGQCLNPIGQSVFVGAPSENFSLNPER